MDRREYLKNLTKGDNCMYIQGKNKKVFTARMNTGRSTTLFILGGIMILLGVVILIAGLKASSDMYYDSDSKNRMLTAIVLIAAVLILGGGGYIINAIAIKSVLLIVYDMGIYGTSMKLNPISGLFTKTKAFDIGYNEITGVRIENGSLMIQRGSEEHIFNFSKEDAQKIQKLILAVKSKRS